jgi:hypothetical protein
MNKKRVFSTDTGHFQAFLLEALNIVICDVLQPASPLHIHELGKIRAVADIPDDFIELLPEPFKRPIPGERLGTCPRRSLKIHLDWALEDFDHLANAQTLRQPGEHISTAASATGLNHARVPKLVQDYLQEARRYLLNSGNIANLPRPVRTAKSKLKNSPKGIPAFP